MVVEEAPQRHGPDLVKLSPPGRASLTESSGTSQVLPERVVPLARQLQPTTKGRGADFGRGLDFVSDPSVGASVGSGDQTPVPLPG